LTPLIVKGFRHADEPQRHETFLRWMCEHRSLFARVLVRRVDGAGIPTIAPSVPAVQW